MDNPAFPMSNEYLANQLVENGQSPEGISKRLYIATEAMKAMMDGKTYPKDNYIRDVVQDAYEIADEMLKQEKWRNYE